MPFLLLVTTLVYQFLLLVYLLVLSWYIINLFLPSCSLLMITLIIQYLFLLFSLVLNCFFSSLTLIGNLAKNGLIVSFLWILTKLFLVRLASFSLGWCSSWLLSSLAVGWIVHIQSLHIKPNVYMPLLYFVIWIKPYEVLCSMEFGQFTHSQICDKTPKEIWVVWFLLRWHKIGILMVLDQSIMTSYFIKPIGMASFCLHMVWGENRNQGWSHLVHLFWVDNLFN